MLTYALLNAGTTLLVGYGAIQASETATSSPSIESFLQYGVLGLVVIGFLTGWIVPGPTAKHLVAENQRLSQLLEEKVIPISATYAENIKQTNAALLLSGQALEANTAYLDRLKQEKEHPSGREAR